MTSQQPSHTATAVRPDPAERFGARALPRRRTARWWRWSRWPRWSGRSGGPRRPRRAWLSRRRLLLAALTVALLAAAAAWAVLWSPLLAVRTITVTGLPAPAAADVRAGAACALGQPLARVDTRALASRVLRPDLDSVTVRRSYPGTLLVRAVLRVAVLATRNSQGQVEVWDRHGVSMGTAAAAPAGVPLLDEGDQSLTPGAVATLAGVLQSLTPAQRQRVSGVAVSPVGMVTFRLGTLGVTWGDAGDSALKARVLDVLAPHAKSTIDVSAPRTPAVH